MRTKNKSKIAAIVLTSSLILSSIALPAIAREQTNNGRWVTGDFHTHTYLTDGSNTEVDVLNNAFTKYGLDWMANSEHGGTSKRDPLGNNLTYPTWRWITLRDLSYPIIQNLRAQYPSKLLVQGVEWNVPTHEHASVGIVSDEPNSISDFEYKFDASDTDSSRAAEGVVKDNTSHTGAIDGAKWLEKNYPTTSYLLLNHPSRQLKFTAADIRDFNNAAPNVFIGLEGIPGHQKESSRGGYESTDPKAQTYGGADYMLAKVGGLWDSLLGEGRKIWMFANSDFHSTAGDFWPGEYSKSYTWINSNVQEAGKGKSLDVNNNNYQYLIDGMRSGNSFIALGDLINGLDFKIKSGNTATMGQTLVINKGKDAQITIKFKSPKTNNNGDLVSVNHIDLIAGDVTAKAEPGTQEFNNDNNNSTKVIAQFTSNDWKYADGWYTIQYTLKNIDSNQYFRLRGTNLGVDVQNQTDHDGNPLSDSLVGTNDSTKAYSDLWFYSNPVFIDVK
ncbi:hypothetical protein ACPUYX_17075 [Desulfosporosinus sp. SYSU MS00001]|uniref:hypothetical protein n=1 Tax=Desulfosporosinus sp. SYSU MS00001 TaxID=3416284 RepID=UPI003CFA7202